MQTFKAGDAKEADTTFGPLVTRRQMERVPAYVQAGIADGANVVTGGKQFLTETGGYFVERTLLTSVKPSSVVAQEEIFGPVLAATTFDTVDEAVQLANSTKYGLAAYVWTRDVSRTMHLMRYLKSGLVASYAAMPKSEGPGSASVSSLMVSRV